MTELKDVTHRTGPVGSKRVRGRSEGRVIPEIENLAETIAMLDDLDNAALRVAWTRAWNRPAPKAARKRFLILGIAWKWQADLLGGFRPELARRLAALDARSGIGLGGSDCSPSNLAAAARPGLGTRLIRDWRGERHEVHVTEKGYLWRGQGYGSLSAVAKAITGVSRNGPKFFGLRAGQGAG